MGVIEGSVRQQQIVALFAGAAVVGMGVVPTLASGDSAYVVSPGISAGRFDLEASRDGEVFVNHARPDRADFQVPVTGSSVSPNERVLFPFAVRLGHDTTYAGRVTITNESASAGHSMVYRTAHFGCADLTDSASATVLLDSRSSRQSSAILLAQPPAGSAGEPVNLCFVVEIRPDLGQGEAGVLAWRLQGESALS